MGSSNSGASVCANSARVSFFPFHQHLMITPRSLVFAGMCVAASLSSSADSGVPRFSIPDQPTTSSARGLPFNNPVISGFSPDPSLCRVGDDFYMVCSSFEYFPGVPVYHSRDLVNWELISYCLSRPSQLPLGSCASSSGIYAPTIRYHDGLFYMTATNYAGKGEFYVTAKDPRGPWSEPVWLKSMCADPSLLFDDDGKVYLVHPASYNPRGGLIYLVELDMAKGAIKEGQKMPGRLIWTGSGGQYPEGPHLYKINGKYYLTVAEGGTGGDHRETIAVSDNPWGPYIPYENNPILTHRDLPAYPISAAGHSDMVQLQDGSWWAVSLGVRPRNGSSALGRETFLMPVEWTEDGWPIYGERRRILVNGAGPALERTPLPPKPVRDAFSADELDLEWNYVRNPDADRFSLTERPGWLRLKGSASTLNDHTSQTVILRRQRHFNLRFSTSLDFNPTRDHEEAGLVLRQTDELHADLCVVRQDGKRHLVLRLVEPKGKSVLSDVVIPDGPVQLSVISDREKYTFQWNAADGASGTAGSIPAEKLSVEASWSNGGVMCFTGMMIGLYATGSGSECSVPADFDWFDYESR